MSPTTGIAASQLHQLIFYHIDNDMLDTANFLAGRLHALEPRNPDSAHLMALTYYRLRRFKATYDFSQKYGASGRHLGCAYVFAQACLELGRYTEGCAALEKARAMWTGKINWKKHSETTRRHLPDAPAVYTLMAKLWRGHGDMKKAGDCYIEAHKAHPFIWDAFEGLCRVGADLNVQNMFRVSAGGVGEVGAAGSGSGGLPDVYTDDQTLQSQPLAAQSNFNQQVFTPTADPFASARVESESGQFAVPKGKSALGRGLKQPPSDWDTPTVNAGMVEEDDVAMGGMQLENEGGGLEPPAAPVRRNRPGHHGEASERPRQPTLRAHGQSSSEALSAEDQRKPSISHKRTISGAQPTSTAAPSDPSAPPRRSNRLFGQTATSKPSRSTADTQASMTGKVDRNLRGAKVATGTKGRASSTVGRVVSGNRKMIPPDPADKEKRAPSRNNSEKPSTTGPGVTSATLQKHTSHSHHVNALTEAQLEQQATASLLESFRHLALGYYSSARFDCPRAIAIFRGLPSAQRETPWVLAQLGKAYYESADYRNAEECFARLLKLQPSRTEDMEVYSTVLWHMKKDNALAFLCHTLRDQDFNAPETWCAVGNAFSLAREHEQAIAAFKRAVQVDERFAYAWTLMGHEYIANEEFDAALSCFRKSVSIDRRCYGGWYGLGKSYERMGKLEDAERHYRIAASINPSNATLLVCIGVVLERLRSRKAALAQYTKALELAPQSALARFKKARTLMHARHYKEALEELEVLRRQAPDEANVWFLLGKCWKGLGEKGEALRALTAALNLDAKAAPFIKEAMEALDEDEEDASESD
ncbi:hypothetical protein D0863_07128 [Hortaea werneckii]|uniref:Uncharacterized protein n=1 Tax=Hortaea werneckii TaxID=91943 RepID=A0A3M7DVJ3_HORWE|nr:hypothetical protein D0863_07128 [Hortaea werneckii]